MPFENPFSEDGGLKEEFALASSNQEGEHSVNDLLNKNLVENEEIAMRKNDTIDTFLNAVQDMLAFANRRYYTLFIENHKRPDEKIHNAYLNFQKKVSNSSRHLAGEIALREYDRKMENFYKRIDEGSADAKAAILELGQPIKVKYQAALDSGNEKQIKEITSTTEYQVFIGSNLLNRFEKAGPNVSNEFIKHFQTINNAAREFFVHDTVKRDISSKTIEKLKNSQTVQNLMGTIGESMAALKEEFSGDEIKSLLGTALNPKVLRSTLAGARTGGLENILGQFQDMMGAFTNSASE